MLPFYALYVYVNNRNYRAAHRARRAARFVERCDIQMCFWCL